MSIATLSTLNTAYFKGSRRLFGAGSADLVGLLNTAITKINEIIAAMNTGALDVLDVGTGTGLYYGTSDSWFQVDGTNPPTFSRFRIQDQADGSFKTATYTTGPGLVFA
jgi:hypothetical protein